MSTNCYQIAFEHAASEIDEINGQIQTLTRRRELLEKLLEPLQLLVLESGSAAVPATVAEDLNTEFSATEAATQESRGIVVAEIREPERGPLEAPVPIMQAEVEETNVHTTRDAGSISHEEVAGLAHRFWNERGRIHGHHEADWFRAAHELHNSAC